LVKIVHCAEMRIFPHKIVLVYKTRWPSRAPTQFEKGEWNGKEKRGGEIPKNRSRAFVPPHLTTPHSKLLTYLETRLSWVVAWNRLYRVDFLCGGVFFAGTADSKIHTNTNMNIRRILCGDRFSVRAPVIWFYEDTKEGKETIRSFCTMAISPYPRFTTISRWIYESQH